MNEKVENDDEKGGIYCYRSAEKKRKFVSLPIADLLAQKSIEIYHSICPSELLDSLKQTVIATIIMEIQDLNEIKLQSKYWIISLGVGTKVLSLERIEKERESFQPLTTIRDLHAEVLAKRGFQRFLYQQLEIFYQSSRSTNYFTIFNAKINETTQKKEPILKENIKFHLCTSSQPCGNACMKRWAKNNHQKDPFLAYDPHERIFLTAKSQGQFAVLTKLNRLDRNVEFLKKQNFTMGEDSLLSDGNRIFPIGTAPTYSQLGNVMTCSDKIAKWNVLGLQGGLLSSFIPPMYLSTVIVGRKFSEVHTKRALCCRLQDYHFVNGQLQLPETKKSAKRKAPQDKPDDKETARIPSSSVHGSVEFRIHHPAILGTAVKLDEGALLVQANRVDDNTKQKVGADFQEKRCLVGWLSSPFSVQSEFTDPSQYEVEILDGSTGLLYDTSEKMSQICSEYFHQYYLKLQSLRANQLLQRKERRETELMYYLELKKTLQSLPYFQAKQFLYTHPDFFSEWMQK